MVELSEFSDTRQSEFSRLGRTIYADYAGAALYSEKQLADVFQDLSASVLGNPHSASSLDDASQDVETLSRSLILDMCNASAEEYDCVFTSGATGGMQMVAECFPWGPGSSFVYSRDNHTSVAGMREVAQRAGANLYCADASHCQGQSEERLKLDSRQDSIHNLFAYPLESNFNGVRYPESLSTAVQNSSCSSPPVSQLSPLDHPPRPSSASTSYDSQQGDDQLLSRSHQTRLSQSNAVEHSGAANGMQSCNEEDRHRWWVLLDAAKACATKPPDLSTNQPAFVVMSCYKIFGYPTGLGALLIRKDVYPILRRAYFGGGTVEACSAVSTFVRRRAGPAGLEHGSSSFLGIAAIPHGFALIKRLGGFPAIHRHASSLARSLIQGLQQLRHFNGQQVCILYTDAPSATKPEFQPPDLADRTVVTLNLLRHDGTYVGYREVERLASLNDIRLRVGCFCNPGACALHLGLDDKSIRENFEGGHVCWDDKDLMDGRPTGAVRLSFGLASNPSDPHRILQFLRQHFVQSSPPPRPPMPANGVVSQPRLKGIWVYPIKSCKGVAQTKWWLGENGLLYDREWALVDSSGRVMTLKRFPQLATITCHIDLQRGVMTVTAPTMTSHLTLHLPPPPHTLSKLGQPASGGASKGAIIHICAESCSAFQVAEKPRQMEAVDAGAWMSKAVGVDCSLVRQQPGSRRMRPGQREVTAGAVRHSLGFANEGQFLLVNQSSLEDLEGRLPACGPGLPVVSVDSFRPNLLVAGAPPFAEDSWNQLTLGSLELEQSDLCARCEVICVDQQTGRRAGVEPLRTLASYRRSKGKITFGILLRCAHSATTGFPQAHEVFLGMPLITSS